MQRSRDFLFFILLTLNLCCMLSVVNVYAQGQATSEAAQTFQGLAPEQQPAAKNKMIKTGDAATADTMKQLKGRAEFKGISPEDIIKGKELLEKQTPDMKKPEQKEETIQSLELDRAKEKSASLFDKYRSTGAYQDISTALTPFGYEIFSKDEARVLISGKDGPVSSDYIVGPGDEIKILLWGRINAQYDLVIDRDGNIMMPQVGPLQIAGMRFEEMKDFLTEQAGQIVGANINITMGSLKSVQVFVLGEVREPGSYSLGSFSTITSALLAAGGPTEIGSLRKIQLKRNNKDIVEMDFYDFLLKGNKQQDQVLQSGDVIFVSTAGPLVGIAGNVKRPAIYELKNRYDLMNLFDMAGGVIPSAYTQQIQVERIQRHEKQIVIDLDDKNLTKSKDFRLQDGDLVKVFPIVDKDANVIFLAGNLKRPGKYEYKTGMRVKDVIQGPADLLKETYLEYALVKRLKPPGLETELIPFHLGKLLFDNEAAHNILLEPQDSIYVFSTWIFKDKPAIFVEGEVRKKGVYELLGNYRIKDAIMEAGGLTKDVSLGRGELFRVNEYGDVSQLYFSVGLAMAEDDQENMLLQDRDKIIIHSIWEEKHKRTVSIDGDIKNPGQYPLASGMHVSDLIFSAGSLVESAFLDEAEVSSFIIDAGQSIRTNYKKINLRLAMDNHPDHNIILKPYDRVFVKRIPEWKEERFAELSGEVRFPGRYIIKKGERLSAVLERAGDYTDSAYLRGAVFTRNSVRESQQNNLDKMILRLERELLTEGASQVSASLTNEEIEAKKAELENRKEFIGSLKKLEAEGRMSIKLAHLRLLKGSIYDIELEDGDRLSIPKKNDVVNVVGAVMSQGSFVYTGELDYKDFIDIAGGYTKYADEENAYVLKVDGTARKLPKGFFNWNNAKDRWEMSAFKEEIRDIEPGDTIVVPEKLDRIAWLRETRDLTQILYQIAVTAGVALLLF